MFLFVVHHGGITSTNAEMRIEKYNKVTKEEVISVSQKITLDTIFMLEGDINE